MTAGDLVEDLARRGFVDLVQIGQGGFAVVYRALQQEYGRTVAVKVLSGGLLDEASLERFNRELRAMGLLSSHPNIVTVYTAGVTHRGFAYLVMEYVSRGSFADRLRRSGPLTWAQSAEVGVKLAGALETSHRMGVLHRDVKPENVLLSQFGEPLLGDFGIARVTGTLVTSSNVQKVTIAHAPPEIFDGERQSARGDVYSLASTLMTLVLGRPPFVRDDDESIVPLYARISRELPPDLRVLGVPPPFCEVLERAMAKDPQQRPASAFDFGQDLQAAQQACGRPPTAMPIGGDDEDEPVASGGPAQPATQSRAPTVTDTAGGGPGSREPAAAALSVARSLPTTSSPPGTRLPSAPVAPAQPPAAAIRPSASRPSAPRRSAARRARRRALGGGIAGLGALALAAFFVLQDDATSVPVPHDGLAVGDDLWVVAGEGDEASLMRLDVATGDLLGGPVSDFPLEGLRAVDEGAATEGPRVWGLNLAAHPIARELLASTGNETEPVEGEAEAIEVDGGQVWVAHTVGQTVRVSIFSTDDANLIGRADAGDKPTADRGGSSLDVEAGVGWVATGSDEVTRLTADAQRLPFFLTEGAALAVAALPDGALVATNQGEVVRLTSMPGEAQAGGGTALVEAAPVVVTEGRALDQIVTDGQTVWVAGPDVGVWRLPAGLDATPERLDLPAGGPKVLALGTTGLWVADPDRGRLHHVMADGSTAEAVDLAELLQAGG